MSKYKTYLHVLMFIRERHLSFAHQRVLRHRLPEMGPFILFGHLATKVKCVSQIHIPRAGRGKPSPLKAILLGSEY